MFGLSVVWLWPVCCQGGDPLEGSPCRDVRVQVCLVTVSAVGRLPLIYTTKLCSAPSSPSPMQIKLGEGDSSGIFKREKDLSLLQIS